MNGYPGQSMIAAWRQPRSNFWRTSRRTLQCGDRLRLRKNSRGCCQTGPARLSTAIRMFSSWLQRGQRPSRRPSDARSHRAYGCPHARCATEPCSRAAGSGHAVRLTRADAAFRPNADRRLPAVSLNPLQAPRAAHEHLFYHSRKIRWLISEPAYRGGQRRASPKRVSIHRLNSPPSFASYCRGAS